MTESNITVTDQETGSDVRVLSRSIGGSTVYIQGITNYRAGIPSYLALYAQHSGTGLYTLPGSHTGKRNEGTGVTTSATQNQILTIRPVRSDIDGVTNYVEGIGVTSGTTIADRIRFFACEELLEPLTLKGTVKFYVNANVKSSSTTACTLTAVKVRLCALTDTDTYDNITDEITVTFGAAISNATTAYVTASAKTVFCTAEVGTQASPAAYTLLAHSRLVLLITLMGTVGSAMTATACVNCDTGSSVTYVEIPIEEAI
jgi:hypothetical protein